MLNSPGRSTDGSLHTTLLGDAGPLVVFCHGLFGQGKNWTTIAKAFAAERRVLLVDMPHHGRSPWRDSFDYVDVADQVAQLLDADDPVALVGHSMGGKAAMVLALRHPQLVERLCVVDVAPVAYSSRSEFAGYIEAMRSMDLDALSRRADADAALTEAVPNPTVRSFLLQNLRHDDGWSWLPNLDVLGRDLEALGGWPEAELAEAAPYAGPTLWVDGRVVGAWAQSRDGEIAVHYFERVAASRRRELAGRLAELRSWVGPTRITLRFPSPIHARLLAGPSSARLLGSPETPR